ncbi:hypothetical protein LOTGIDRAFT_203718 [Lottia gigantea]|uniref:WD repeat-containing protein 54 beta-propeller domain-containing protein n=1 Tax=Lottia gigantea TaxID=225164 RepID=V4AMB2_LOTGI|nr:hypothetical protein LOTGIDRAFT_203718 [Lottia gigantea]ESO98292.1 hypothetical protein LOTGIDRAFT_203718 [Lottia gigantea]
MFRKEKPISIKGSTSSLCNNLSVMTNAEKGLLSYAVVHKSIVNIIQASTDGSSVTGKQLVYKEPTTSHGNPFVFQAKWIELPQRTVLVLTSQRGIQIFDGDGSTMIYWHALSDEPDRSCFGRGITDMGDNLICIGTEGGHILIFNIPPKGTNVCLLDVLKGSHPCAICDLASEKNILVSSDDQGNIAVWKFLGQQFHLVHKIAGGGAPCTSVSIWKDVVVGAYGTGHIRVYDATSGRIGAEVTAHARCINSLHVAKKSGLLLSVSDDSFFRIWQLKEGSLPQIQHKYQEIVEDLQLVGGSFVDSQGRALCLTGYDNSEIHFYVQN